jgi:hypothetical protein
MAESRIEEEMIILGAIDVVQARGHELIPSEAEGIGRALSPYRRPGHTDHVGQALECLGRSEVDIQGVVSHLTAQVLKSREAHDR